MNITLSADKELIEEARKYAKKKQTSLNSLIRELLNKIINNKDTIADADEFESLALNYSGKSEDGYKFDRDEIYQRGDKV